MDRAVISEKLIDLIDGREVLAAVFTTYTFEPEFFELEVIPLLLPHGVPYSTDDRVKRFQVREHLRECGLPIEVFYDMPTYRLSGEQSPDMEYLCHGVSLGNRAFHGKLVMLLVRDDESEEEALLVGAGSNNLSRSGWWDNIECLHWEEVLSGLMPRRLLNRLRDDVNYLVDHSGIAPDKAGALDYVGDFLDECKGSNSADPVFYYGLHRAASPNSFLDYLDNAARPLAKYGNWTLEIVSPFFADDVENAEHDAFLDLGVQKIHLLLPFDDEGNALCHPDYYIHIEKNEHVAWARWRPELAKSLSVQGEFFRRLHAKLYHFYNKKQSWVFVGSVNFTHKALYENAEAGFLVKLDRAGPLLEELPKSVQVDEFGVIEDVTPGATDDVADSGEFPEIHLHYDWIGKKLLGRTSRQKMAYRIEILGAEGEPVITSWEVPYKSTQYTGDCDELEHLLKSGSLVKIRGVNAHTNAPFTDHVVLLQQVGWTHKPLDLPDLTPEQILAIYADMDPERRHLMLLNAKIRKLVLSSQGGELTTHQDEQFIDQFFCEYAEIFQAFRKLKQKLLIALEEEETVQVDYYLTGTGADSLPVLIDRTEVEEGDKAPLSGVTTYVLMLCVLELYREKKFCGRPNVDVHTHLIEKALSELKRGPYLVLENNSKQNREKFFRWFETQFYQSYAVRGQS